VKDPDADCYQWGSYDPSTNRLDTINGETYQAYAAGAAYNQNYRYWVKTWKGDCSSEPDCATISYLMQLPEETDTPRAVILGLYPNPNDGNFFLKAEGLPATQYALAVTDALGRSVLHRTLTTPNGRLEEWIQLPFAPNGLYHALLRDEQGRLFRAIPFILLK
jgi:hypothetical protein